MRVLTLLALPAAVIVCAIAAYDRLRDAPSREAGTGVEDSAALRRVQRLERRLAWLEDEVARLATQRNTNTEAGERHDPRLHTGADRPEIHAAVIERWEEGLARLRAQRLREDERRYVRRRLVELELDLSIQEQEAATRVVLAFFRAKAAAWQRVHALMLDPISALEVYDEITYAHHAALAKVIREKAKAERIAEALMPLR